MAVTDGLRDGRETGGHRDLIVLDESVPLALQQLSLAFHKGSLDALESSERRVHVSAA